ncbi:MAG: heme lyase CcmF/NrfE family subunit [Oligoflexales bacterium]
MSSKFAITTTAVLATAAAGVLFYSFFMRDYSLRFVAYNSSNDLPPFYTMTAFWSALEGSHLLWTWLLSLIAVIAAWSHSKDNEHIMPYVLGSLHAILGWMFYLCISASDPFIQQLPSPANGTGMNELLQNFYMGIHPPLLFTGYTSLAIPFAYSIAALGYGDVTEGWLKTVRRWTLVSWCCLTAAMTLGGRWAYVELGWGGYWAWDPVENSVFLPWLFATALLHSLVVQDKLGHLKRLSIVLAIVSFFMTFFGTFLTRSGVVSSVHSFAESNIGANYLIYLTGVAFIACLLYLFRAPTILPSENEKVWGVSKESALVFTQFLLLSFGAIVFTGTIFPIVSEAITDQRISIQAPYFNSFAPYVGLATVLAIAVGNLMRYRTSKMPGAAKVMLISAVLAVPMGALLVYFGDVMETEGQFALGAQIAGMYAASWSTCCLIGDFWLKARDLRFAWRLFFDRNLAYTGAFIAHLGFMLAIIGILGNYRGLQHQATLNVGQKTSIHGYEFQLMDKIRIYEKENATMFGALIDISRNGKYLGEVESAQSVYPTKPGQAFNEIGVLGSFWNDVYVVLADWDKQGRNFATLNIHINPTVRFVWTAVVIMVIGGFVSLFDKYRGQRSRDVVGALWEAKSTIKE